MSNFDSPPTRRLVTLFARTSERAHMRIIASVTAGTVRGDFQRRRILDHVATLAPQLRMRANQWVTCLSPVIEAPMRPGARIMTAPTFRLRAEKALMVILVTALARHRQL